MERLARGRNLRIECVLTDHHEDLPLLSLPNIERILVTPSSHTESVVRERVWITMLSGTKNIVDGKRPRHGRGSGVGSIIMTGAFLSSVPFIAFSSGVRVAMAFLRAWRT